MPVYTYRCDNCGLEGDIYGVPVDRRDDPVPCPMPGCGAIMGRPVSAPRVVHKRNSAAPSKPADTRDHPAPDTRPIAANIDWNLTYIPHPDYKGPMGMLSNGRFKINGSHRGASQLYKVGDNVDIELGSDFSHDARPVDRGGDQEERETPSD